MILPASYSTGFAPRDDAPLYPQLWKGCVGAWNMGLGPTGNTLRDWSGFGNHGTLTNGPTWQASQGKYAISLDGSNDYISVTDSNQWHKSDFTFSCFANFRSAGAANYNTVISKDNGGTNWVFFSRDAQSFSGKMSVNFYDGSNNPNVQSTTIISLNIFYHLVFSVSGNTCFVYINGSSESSVSIAAWTRPTINNYTLGYWNIAGGRPMDGVIDDCRLYNRALSPYEIRLLASRRGIAYEMRDRRWARQIPATTSGYSVFKSSIIRASA